MAASGSDAKVRSWRGSGVDQACEPDGNRLSRSARRPVRRSRHAGISEQIEL